MRKLLFLAFLFTACTASPTAAPTLESPQATPELLLVVQSTRAPEMTATAAVDMVATQVMLLHAWQTAQADNDALRAQISGQAVQLHQIELDVEAAKLETAKYNAAIAESEARKSGMAANVAKYEADVLALQVEAERILTERIKAEAEAERARGDQILLLCIVAVLVVGAIVTLRLTSRYPVQVAEPVDENEMERQAEHGPLVVQQTTQNGGYVSAMLYEIPEMYATRKQLEIVANGVRDGRRLSHAELTPRSICFSEGQFTAFQYFLVEKTPYAEWVDASNIRSGISLTPAGEQFFAKLQTANPFPTPEDFTPIGDFQPMADR